MKKLILFTLLASPAAIGAAVGDTCTYAESCCPESPTKTITIGGKKVEMPLMTCDCMMEKEGVITLNAEGKEICGPDKIATTKSAPFAEAAATETDKWNIQADSLDTLQAKLADLKKQGLNVGNITHLFSNWYNVEITPREAAQAALKELVDSKAINLFENDRIIPFVTKNQPKAGMIAGCWLDAEKTKMGELGEKGKCVPMGTVKRPAPPKGMVY